jgi:hypothetical protein
MCCVLCAVLSGVLASSVGCFVFWRSVEWGVIYLAYYLLLKFNTFYLLAYSIIIQ